LAAFEALPPERAQYELARPTYFYFEEDAGPESLEREDVRAQVEYRMGAELARQLFDDPAAVQARVVEMLAAYWEESFAEEWSRLEPLLAEEVERARGRDPIELLVEVTPDNPLRLIPSVYVWPHVRVNCDAPWPLAVLYPPTTMGSGLAGQPAPDELVRPLRAAADPTRLRILQLVAEQPRSTEELAPLVGLSESGLSKHLRALTEAGLLSTKRDGYYVLYRLERERLEALGPELNGYVG
jgi:DNA-binding transcriptional ArsR family regulator